MAKNDQKSKKMKKKKKNVILPFIYVHEKSLKMTIFKKNIYKAKTGPFFRFFVIFCKKVQKSEKKGPIFIRLIWKMFYK